MKKFISIAFMVLLSVYGYSQSASSFSKMKHNRLFQHFDASVSLGSTGIGVEVISPIGNYVNIRAGFDFIPRFTYHMNFGVQVGDDPELSEIKFQRLSGLLEGFTGFKVDNQIEMIGKPTMNNFKFLVDVFPIKNNKKFHVTAGFYFGSSQIAKAYNVTEDMPSLMSVKIYNNIYDKIMRGEPIYKDTYLDYDLEEKILNYGRMAICLGNYSHDIYDTDGNLIHAKGDYYMMEPDENSMCKANVNVNSFKPYLGVGYGGRLIKNTDKYHFAVDCGVLFWGGSPNIVTHDGTDFAKDVDLFDGKVGDYVDLLKGFKIYPVLNIRFIKTLF